MIIWLFFNAMCVWIYMYVHPEININMETRHFCIKMRSKHQHNSSCLFFLTEKCQMLRVVKLWATWWVGFGWIECCLSSREPCFVLEPGPSAPLASAFEMGHGQGARGVSCLAPANLGWLAQSRFKLQLLESIHSPSRESNGPLQGRERMGLDCTWSLCLPF